MSKKKKVIPEKGMFVAVPLSNKKFGLANICWVENLSETTYHTIWAFYDCVGSEVSELAEKIQDENYLKKPFLVCGMDYEELEKGKWPVIEIKNVDYTNVDITSPELFQKLLKENIGGAMLLEMYLGVQPWNLYKDPDYLDKRLLPGFSRPANVKLKEDLSK